MTIQLIVGLGNPGVQYDQTRHNAGFWFVDELARVLGLRFKMDKRSGGELAVSEQGGEKLFLLKPMQFMNRSGQAVAAIANFYKIDVDSILVVHDELDLEPATLRFKKGGGHGGHNGLRDIDAQLGNKQYWRLRVGIGHPGHKDKVTPWVLGKPPVAQRQTIDLAFDALVHQRSLLLSGEMVQLMNKIH